MRSESGSGKDRGNLAANHRESFLVQALHGSDDDRYSKALMLSIDPLWHKPSSIAFDPRLPLLVAIIRRRVKMSVA